MFSFAVTNKKQLASMHLKKALQQLLNQGVEQCQLTLVMCFSALKLTAE